MTVQCMTPLFVPANRPDRYKRAADSGADAIIIDLEDAIAPSEKAAARLALASSVLPDKVPTIVRINGRGTPWHPADLACIAPLSIEGVMLPKAELIDDVMAVREILGERALFVMIESARGLVAARQIASLGGALRLAFGSLDFSYDNGCAHTREALLSARSEIVLASRLARLTAPLDGVSTALDDIDSVALDARHAAEIGFGGKLCVHPRQIAVVRSAFTPSDAEIAWAQRMIEQDQGGATAIDGSMVDAPVLAKARRILCQLP
jgi:citrate lyase subunit beta / citryl-CoA lyase